MNGLSSTIIFLTLKPKRSDRCCPESVKGIEIGNGERACSHPDSASVKASSHRQKMAAKAAARGIQMIDAYAENLPIGDNTYDYALMVTVDCFLQDVLKSFQEIRRILRAGGSFIIAFIDKATPLGRIYEAHKATSLFYRNARFHTSEEIGELLKTAGFKAEEARQTIFTLENHPQEIRDGTGEGVFAVIKATRIE